MALAASGKLSLGDVRTQFGKTGTISMSTLYDSKIFYKPTVSPIPETGTISLTQFYGRANNIPILDTAGATPFAGYSVRRLYSTYNGPMVQVRRSTDNAVLAFYGDVNGIVGTSVNGRGTKIAAWLNGATGYIVRMYDQTGNNRYMEETDTTRQPTIVASSTYSGIRFNFSRLRHYFTGTITSFTMIGMCNFNYGSAAGYFGIEDSSGNVFDTLVKNESVYELLHGSDYLSRTYGSSTAVTGKKSAALLFGPSNSRMYVNGAQVASSTAYSPVTYTNQHFHLGYRHSFGATGPLYNSEIFEVLYFASALAAATISTISASQTTSFA